MKIRGGARRLLSCLLDVLAPRRCVACDELEPSNSEYCAICGEPDVLLDIARHIDGVPVFAGARYAEPVISAIQRFKYGAAPELSGGLAALAARGVEMLGVERGDVWVPVPLHPLRLAERGYNQSALLARELSRLTHGRFDARRLSRLRHTEQQAKHNRRARSQNVVDAFRVRDRASSQQRILLVDDVVTTGATLAACIRALRAAGDDVLGCVTVAHTAASTG